MLKFPDALFRVRRAVCLVAGLLCLAGSAHADVLVTGQGESLSGELVRIADGILVFRTSLRGQMMVPMEEVERLKTESAWLVTEADGDVHVGRFVSGGIARDTGEDGEGQVSALDLAAVTSARALPSALEAPSRAGDRAWSGFAGIGARAFEGTESGVEPHLRLGVRGLDERGEMAFDLGFDVGQNEGFPSYLRGRFEVAGVAPQSWEPFVQALVERDHNKALRFRTGLTVGVRYDFDGGRTGGLQGIAGLGGVYSRWDPAYLNAGFVGLARDKQDERYLNLHLELRYSRAVWGGATWDSRFFLLPGVTDADRFRAGAASSLVYPFSNRLQLRLDMLLDYDSDPVFRAIDRVDTSLGASIQLDF